MRLIHWIGAVSIAANRLVNALTGGDPQMSVSARAGLAREHHRRAGVITCKLLGWMDPIDGKDDRDHCNVAVVHYWERKNGT
jgi:hypothetical protein